MSLLTDEQIDDALIELNGWKHQMEQSVKQLPLILTWKV